MKKSELKTIIREVIEESNFDSLRQKINSNNRMITITKQIKDVANEIAVHTPEAVEYIKAILSKLDGTYDGYVEFQREITKLDDKLQKESYEAAHWNKLLSSKLNDISIAITGLAVDADEIFVEFANDVQLPFEESNEPTDVSINTKEYTIIPLEDIGLPMGKFDTVNDYINSVYEDYYILDNATDFVYYDECIEIFEQKGIDLEENEKEIEFAIRSTGGRLGQYADEAAFYKYIEKSIYDMFGEGFKFAKDGKIGVGEYEADSVAIPANDLMREIGEDTLAQHIEYHTDPVYFLTEQFIDDVRGDGKLKGTYTNYDEVVALLTEYSSDEIELEGDETIEDVNRSEFDLDVDNFSYKWIVKAIVADGGKGEIIDWSEFKHIGKEEFKGAIDVEWFSRYSVNLPEKDDLESTLLEEFEAAKG